MTKIPNPICFFHFRGGCYKLSTSILNSEETLYLLRKQLYMYICVRAVKCVFYLKISLKEVIKMIYIRLFITVLFSAENENNEAID